MSIQEEAIIEMMGAASGRACLSEHGALQFLGQGHACHRPDGAEQEQGVKLECQRQTQGGHQLAAQLLYHRHRHLGADLLAVEVA